MDDETGGGLAFISLASRAVVVVMVVVVAVVVVVVVDLTLLNVARWCENKSVARRRTERTKVPCFWKRIDGDGDGDGDDRSLWIGTFVMM